MRKTCYFRPLSSLFLLVAWVVLSYLFIRANQSLVSCLQGIPYQKKDPDMTALSCNILYHMGLVLILGSGLWRDRDENNEMSLIRYGSYRRYYGSVYRKTVLTSLLYDVLSFDGLLAGEVLGSRIQGEPAQISLLVDMCSLYLCNHLFWCLLIAWSMVEKKNIRLSFLLYPGVFLFTIVLSRGLPQSINRWVPGNWMMLYRSDRYQDAGYSRNAVRVGLLAVFALLIIKGNKLRNSVREAEI